MKKERKRTLLMLQLLLLWLLFGTTASVQAEETSPYMTTVTVNGNDNVTENLLYAIDSDEEEAFTESNIFTVEAGTTHNVYIKDEAGNISGQIVVVPEVTDGLNVNVGTAPNTENGNSTGISDDLSSAPEYGTGTLVEDSSTSESSDADKEFFTINSKSGSTFYLVVDKGQSREGNVYLLDQVTDKDLSSLAATSDDDSSSGSSSSGSIFGEIKETTVEESQNSEETTEEIIKEQEEVNTTKKSSDVGTVIGIIFLLGIGGAVAYIKFFMKTKHKYDEDAMDLDDFEATDDEEMDLDEEDDADDEVEEEEIPEQEISKSKSPDQEEIKETEE